MRSYPQNSPQAAARTVAVALLADGHLCKAELDRLRELHAAQSLGLSDADLQAVLHAFCEDLLATSQAGWGDACRIDGDTLAALLAEVDDVALQRTVLQLCLSAVQADEHLADGESLLLQAMVQRWATAAEALAQPA